MRAGESRREQAQWIQQSSPHSAAYPSLEPERGMAHGSRGIAVGSMPLPISKQMLQGSSTALGWDSRQPCLIKPPSRSGKAQSSFLPSPRGDPRGSRDSLNRARTPTGHYSSVPTGSLSRMPTTLARPAAQPSSRALRTSQSSVLELDVSSSEVGAFFRAADAFMPDSAAYTGTGDHMAMGAMGGSGRAPPAGMRGALSWGVGPNAYENDGRPGTRGGTTAFDLEGRPLTRGAQRPPSRIQINLTAGGGGLGSTGLDALSHSSYASAVAVSASPVPGMAQYRRSSIEASSRGGAGGRPASSALSLARVPALGSTAPKTPPTTADGQRAGAPQPRSENRNGRGVGVPFPGGTRGYPSSSSRTRGTVLGSGGMGAGPGRLPGSGPLGRSQANIFKVEEEVPLDADAFLDSLSAADDDDTATAMDDLATFLRRTSHQGRQFAPEPGKQPGRPKQNSMQGTPERQQAPASHPPNGSLTNANPKAVRTALRILDIVIGTAVQTAEVNVIIRQAELKALAEEEAHPSVVLMADGWQESVRSALGPLEPVGHGAPPPRQLARPAQHQSWSHCKVRKLAWRLPCLCLAPSPHLIGREAELPPLPPLPDDDFRHLGARQQGRAVPGAAQVSPTSQSPARAPGRVLTHPSELPSLVGMLSPVSSGLREPLALPGTLGLGGMGRYARIAS